MRVIDSWVPTEEEWQAYEYNRGILADAPALWTIEEFCNVLTTLNQLRSDILEDNDNKVSTDFNLLTIVTDNLYAAGCRQGPSIMSPINKELLLTICGQLQVKSQSNIGHGRVYYHFAAAALRRHLYRNYTLANGPIYKDAQGTVPASGDSLARPS
jgi:hypothetical protein